MEKQAQTERRVQTERQAQTERWVQTERQAQKERQAQMERQVQTERQAQAENGAGTGRGTLPAVPAAQEERAEYSLREEAGRILQGARERVPLVQCITNFVTVNDCANMILAAGGSPTMAHDIREASEAAQAAQALVCNLGAIEDVEAMIQAGETANRLGIPAVLDPVACGGTSLRRKEAKRLLEKVHFSVIRGNASEIRFLAGERAEGAGVDAGRADQITEGNLFETARMTEEFAKRTGSVIAVSGSADLVSDGRRTAIFRNGCPIMARITGSGCMMTALTGAFCGGAPDRPFEAACAAAAAMGVCGELAEKRRLENGTGNASFCTYLIDAVFNLTEKQLLEGMKYEIYKGRD